MGLWEEPPILLSGLDMSLLPSPCHLPSPGDRRKGLQRSHLARLPHLINPGVQSGEQVCRDLGAWGSGGLGEGAAGAAEARTSLQFLKTLFLGGCRLDFMALTADPWIIKQEMFSLGGNITVLQNSCTLVPAAAAAHGEQCASSFPHSTPCSVTSHCTGAMEVKTRRNPLLALWLPVTLPFSMCACAHARAQEQRELNRPKSSEN